VTLTLSHLDQNVVIFLDLNLGTIPKKARKLESGRIRDVFRTPYYQVDMDIVVEIDIRKWADKAQKPGRVLIRLVCAGTALLEKSSQLEDEVRQTWVGVSY
jgi:hypothetical protein